MKQNAMKKNQWRQICIVSIRGVKRQLLINEDQIVLKGKNDDEGYMTFNSMEEFSSFINHVKSKGIQVDMLNI